MCHGCCHTAAPAPAAPAAKEMPKKASADEAVPATIVVNVPAQAKVTVDGVVTSSTSTQRTFVSPALEVGGEYYYNLRAEIVRDGQTVVETQRVTVRAGETTQATFNFSSQGVASR